MNKIVIVCLLSLMSLSTFAVERTVTLKVPTMNCAICPITVKKALQTIDGVTKVDVTFETKLAVVRFHDERTSVNALTEATANAGYPSIEKNGPKNNE